MLTVHSTEIVMDCLGMLYFWIQSKDLFVFVFLLPEEKKAFDLVFFSKRLERALEAAMKRRTAPKVRQPREKKATKPRKKPKGNK